MSNYYAQDFGPWVSNIRNMGTMLMQMPALKARIAAQQQLAAYRQAEIGRAYAQTDEAGARTRKSNAEASDIEDQTASGNRLSDALKKVAADPNNSDAVGDALSEFGHYFKKNPEEAAKGLGQLTSQFMAMRGSKDFAQMGAMQGQAASIANNEANNDRIMKTPMTVPDNSVAIDKTTGKPVAISPQKLPMGQLLFRPGADNVTLNSQPAAAGNPAPPKSSAAESTRAHLAADLVKGGNSIDPSITGTNAATGLKLFDAIALAKNNAGGAAAPGAASASAAPYIQPTEPGPAQPTVMVNPNGGGTNNVPSAQDLITQAQDAISRGADPVKVKSRLLNQYKINLP